MKNLIFLLVGLLFTNSVIAQILPQYSGSWYNPNQVGQGLNIEVLSEERSIFYWFHYNADGEPMWFLGDGVNEGKQIRADLYLYKLGEINPLDWSSLTNEIMGWQVEAHDSVTITFQSCDSATLEWSFNLSSESWQPPLALWHDGQIPLERLTNIAGMHCVDAEDLTGDWYVAFEGMDEELSWVVRTTVAEDGTWEYVLMANRAKGQITVDAETGNISTTRELPGDDIIQTLQGKYLTGTVLCFVEDHGYWDGCETFSEVIYFESTDRSNYLTFFR